MSVQGTENGYWLHDAARARQNIQKALGIALQTVFGAIVANTRPARAHFVDHVYSWAGFGCISAASFVHSVFTGLLVTGILALVFEWKVGE
jgi:hypothetical protein